MKKYTRLEDFLPPTEKELFDDLTKMYSGAIVSKGDYILVPGEAPIMLVAHLDTVHEKPCQIICKSERGNILMSPQGIGGDDRCGVFALHQVWERSDKKPWLLFTCQEEVGGVGAGVFCRHHQKGKLPDGLDILKAIIEIDRKGKNDAVYYDCANEDFETYISSKGFKTNYGSFSDISLVAPELGVAAVNLSSGYYNAHTKYEYINRKQLNRTIRRVVQIVAESLLGRFPRYEYKDAYEEFDHEEYLGVGRYRFYHTEELNDIPEGIKIEYDLLLDYYTKRELDKIRGKYGDLSIQSLAQSEFGDEYDSFLYGEEFESEGK